MSRYERKRRRSAAGRKPLDNGSSNEGGEVSLNSPSPPRVFLIGQLKKNTTIFRIPTGFFDRMRRKERKAPTTNKNIVYFRNSLFQYYCFPQPPAVHMIVYCFDLFIYTGPAPPPQAKHMIVSCVDFVV